MKKLKFPDKRVVLPAVIFTVIFVIGLFFRFENYQNRWTLSQDQARDAVISRFAIATGQIPVLGPHSSAGDFSFGPLYYWLTIFFTYIFSGQINGGWIGFTLLACLSVAVFTWIGYKLHGPVAAVFFGLTAALSPAQILHAPDMLNPIPIPFFISLALLSLLYFFSSRRIYFALLAGFFIGLATQLHFQTLIVLPLFYIVSVLFYKRVPLQTVESAWKKHSDRGFIKSFIHLWKVSLGPRTMKRLLVFAYQLAGFFIGISPLFYFDLAYGNKLVANFLEFYLNGQKNMAVYISWFDDLIVFWPKFFGEVLINIPAAGYFITGLIIISSGLMLYKKSLRSVFAAAIFSSVLIQILLLHFYKGPRTPVYMLVFHPFIIIVFAWTMFILYRINKIAGLAVFAVFISLAIWQDFKVVKKESSLQSMRVYQEHIDKKSPGKVSLYEGNESTMISYPVFYLLDYAGKIESGGYKIGLCEDKDLIGSMGDNLGRNCPKEPSPFQSDGHYLLYDLNGLSDEKIEELRFTPMSAGKIFNTLYKGYTL